MRGSVSETLKVINQQFQVQFFKGNRRTNVTVAPFFFFFWLPDTQFETLKFYQSIELNPADNDEQLIGLLLNKVLCELSPR